MSKILSNKLLARTVLVAALALCALVYYLKSPDVRAWVDAKAPVVKQWIGPLVAKWDQRFPMASEPAPVVAAPKPIAAATSAQEPAAAPSSTPVAEKAEPATPRNEDVDLAQLSQSRSKWPKAVTLKKPVEFPAVMDGKIIGNVKSPAGVEARLVMMRGTQVGVEYQGGGAMVDIADTDLIERVQPTGKQEAGGNTPGMATAAGGNPPLASARPATADEEAVPGVPFDPNLKGRPVK